jgi:uncharacterized membrane-anchored protein YhcB (DUF1043 family)
MVEQYWVSIGTLSGLTVGLIIGFLMARWAHN